MVKGPRHMTDRLCKHCSQVMCQGYLQSHTKRGFFIQPPCKVDKMFFEASKVKFGRFSSKSVYQNLPWKNFNQHGDLPTLYNQPSLWIDVCSKSNCFSTVDCKSFNKSTWGAEKHWKYNSAMGDLMVTESNTLEWYVLNMWSEILSSMSYHGSEPFRALLNLWTRQMSWRDDFLNSSLPLLHIFGFLSKY